MKRIGNYVYDEVTKNYYKIDPNYYPNNEKLPIKIDKKITCINGRISRCLNSFLQQSQPTNERSYEKFVYSNINYSKELFTRFNFVSLSFLQYSTPSSKFECIINSIPNSIIANLSLLSFEDSKAIEYIAQPSSLRVDVNQRTSVFQWLVQDSLYLVENKSSVQIIDCSDPDIRRVPHEIGKRDGYRFLADFNYYPYLILYRFHGDLIVKNISNDTEIPLVIRKRKYNYITMSSEKEIYSIGFIRTQPFVEKINVHDKSTCLSISNFSIDNRIQHPCFLTKIDDTKVAMSYINGSFKIYDERFPNQAFITHLEEVSKHPNTLDNVFKRKFFISQSRNSMAIQTGSLEENKVKVFDLNTGQALRSFCFQAGNPSNAYSPFFIAFHDIQEHKYQSPKLYIFNRNNIYVCR